MSSKHTIYLHELTPTKQPSALRLTPKDIVKVEEAYKEGIKSYKFIKEFSHTLIETKSGDTYKVKETSSQIYTLLNLYPKTKSSTWHTTIYFFDLNSDEIYIDLGIDGLEELYEINDWLILNDNKSK